MDGSSDDYINLAKYVVLDKERQGRKGQLVSERFCGILEKNAGKNKDQTRIKRSKLILYRLFRRQKLETKTLFEIKEGRKEGSCV